MASNIPLNGEASRTLDDSGSFGPIYETLLQGMHQPVDAAGQTFVNQEKLPKLPLPKLADTFARLKNSLLPIAGATPETLAQYDQLASDAVEKLGVAQKQLEAKHQATENYLMPWWEDYAYLSQRDPIPCSTNVFGVREADFHPKTGLPSPPIDNCVDRAALLMLEVMCLNSMLTHGALPAEATRGGPLCMEQYRKFISVRKPGMTKDSIVTTPATESDSFHVMHRGAHFILKAFPLGAAETPSGKAACASALNYAELVACTAEGIRQLEESGGHPKHPNECIGALTAGDRTSWAEAWAELEAADPQNKANFEQLMKCMSGIALDDLTEVHSMKQAAEQVMFRNPYNRWYDRNSVKGVSKNGVVYESGDHTPMDAVVLAYIPFELIPSASAYVWKSGGFFGDEHQTVRPGFNPKDFVKVLKWTIPDSVKVRVEKALAAHAAISGPAGVEIPHGQFHDESSVYPGRGEVGGAVYTQVDIFKYSGLGRLAFKEAMLPGAKKRGVSGDAVLQQVLQLAFYLDRGRLTPGYESASTRGFKMGRTDTIRPFTVEQKDFVLAAVAADQLPADVDSAGAGATEPVSMEELQVLLAKAIGMHLRVAARASSGQGTERHLFALKIAQAGLGLPLPDAFDAVKSPLLAAAGNYCLLTSQVPGQVFIGGFGHCWGDGYGCCYYLRKREVAIMVTGHKKAGLTDLDRFQGNLTKAFQIVSRILGVGEGNSGATAATTTSSSKL